MSNERGKPSIPPISGATPPFPPTGNFQEIPAIPPTAPSVSSSPAQPPTLSSSPVGNRSTKFTAVVMQATAKTTAGKEKKLNALKKASAKRVNHVTKFFSDAPPWLASAVIHMVLIILFGLLMVAGPKDPPPELTLDYAEHIGEQLDAENIDEAALDSTDKEQVLTAMDLEAVEDPFATPPEVDLQLRNADMTSDITSDVVGVALSGREKGSKETLLAAYGGNGTTQQAVVEGLRWLARNQKKNGLWSLSGPFSSGVRVPGEPRLSINEQAATAMALLAFQGNGHTHKGDPSDPFNTIVARAWTALLKRQDQKTGNFAKGIYYTSHQLYTHAQCTIALCELYAMTEDEALKEPAQKAVDYCVKVQDRAGGWRYSPGSESDTSVTGWYVMALKSAQMAGLQVPSSTMLKIGQYLDSVSYEDGAEYSYLPNDGIPLLSMSAEGLLCRQYLGWQHTDERLVKGVQKLVDNPIDYSNMSNVYYWYYATQVCHHMEGKPWRAWNKIMRVEVPKHQVKKGKERGSWDPENDRWGSQGGGRLFTTCLSIYMLEVYYRHLPLYRKELAFQ